MRTKDELIKEALDECVVYDEQEFKAQVRRHICDIVQGQKMIAEAQGRIKTSQKAIKELELEAPDKSILGQ